MRVKAKGKVYYGGREYMAGEEFDMDDREEAEAKMKETLGQIEIVKEVMPNAGASEHNNAQPASAETPVRADPPKPSPARPMTLSDWGGEDKT